MRMNVQIEPSSKVGIAFKRLLSQRRTVGSTSGSMIQSIGHLGMLINFLSRKVMFLSQGSLTENQ